jgi:hypothetical protein
MGSSGVLKYGKTSWYIIHASSLSTKADSRRELVRVEHSQNSVGVRAVAAAFRLSPSSSRQPSMFSHIAVTRAQRVDRRSFAAESRGGVAVTGWIQH